MATPLRAGALLSRLTFSNLLGAELSITLRSPCTCVGLLNTTQRWDHRPQQVPQIRQFHATPTTNLKFFNSLTADDLWKGVSGVSNAGKKKGRGKRVGRKNKANLNRGQVIGTGKSNMLWPGLNAPILKSKEVVQRTQLPPNPDREMELIKMRDQMSRIRYTALPPLQRGWSGSRFPGQSIGPPNPIDDYTFEGFDTKVLEFKLVTNMTGNLGRKMRFSCLVVTGNKNGLAGFALAKAPSGKAAIRQAKNKAAQRLQYVERYQDHTVYHNIYTKHHKTAIFIKKREAGSGLRCHRAIKTICELIGIKDLHAKVEGSTKNIQSLTKALFEGLREQQTHQELSDEKGLNVVECREERENFPVVVASPSIGKTTAAAIGEDEDVDFDTMYYGGKVEYRRPKKPNFYESFRSYKVSRMYKNRVRNQPRAQLLRQAGLW